MISPINLRGYASDDPLDRLPPVRRSLLAMAVTAVVTTLLVILIAPVFHLVQFAGLWFAGVEVAVEHRKRTTSHFNAQCVARQDSRGPNEAPTTAPANCRAVRGRLERKAASRLNSVPE